MIQFTYRMLYALAWLMMLGCAVPIAAQVRDVSSRSVIGKLGLSHLDFDRYVGGEREAVVVAGALRYRTHKIVSPQVEASLFRPDGIHAVLLSVGLTFQNPRAAIQPYIGASSGFGVRTAGPFEGGVLGAVLGGVRFHISERSRLVVETRATSVKRISNHALQLTVGYEWLRF